MIAARYAKTLAAVLSAGALFFASAADACTHSPDRRGRDGRSRAHTQRDYWNPSSTSLVVASSGWARIPG